METHRYCFYPNPEGRLGEALLRPGHRAENRAAVGASGIFIIPRSDLPRPSQVMISHALWIRAVFFYWLGPWITLPNAISKAPMAGIILFQLQVRLQ